MSVIRSSGWKTDAIIVVPESLLLSFAALLLLEKFGFTGNSLYFALLIICFSYSLLMALSAYWATKKTSQQEDVAKEAEKMNALGIPATIIEHAAIDSLEDEKKWQVMVHTYMGENQVPPSSPMAIFFRSFWLAFLAGIMLLLPYTFSAIFSGNLRYVFTAIILCIVGGWKYAITDRSFIIGSLRLLIQAFLIVVLIEAIYRLAG